MAAGLASASRILMARKPPVGTDYRQELSRAPLTAAFLIETAVLSSRAVSTGGEVKRLVAPCRINSLVFPFVRTRRRVESITDKPLPYARRHYQLTLCHYRGSLPLYFIWVSSVRALY